MKLTININEICKRDVFHLKQKHDFLGQHSTNNVGLTDSNVV